MFFFGTHSSIIQLIKYCLSTEFNPYTKYFLWQGDQIATSIIIPDAWTSSDIKYSTVAHMYCYSHTYVCHQIVFPVVLMLSLSHKHCNIFRRRWCCRTIMCIIIIHKLIKYCTNYTWCYTVFHTTGVLLNILYRNAFIETDILLPYYYGCIWLQKIEVDIFE